VVLILTITYAWMVTDPSYGELVEYNRRFIITDSDIEVNLYVLKNNEYVKQEHFNPLITLDLMEPGKVQRYRFDIKNNNSIKASTNIVFTQIGWINTAAV